MTKLYGIVAHPASHSLSPAMHNAAFEHLGIDADYLAFDVRPGDIGAFMKILLDENIWGLSVSMPHKEGIMPFLDKIDKVALEIEAVNTVYRKDNKFIGTNFDWLGIKNPLGNVKGKKVLLLGAGGAAQAACYALKGSKVAIWNRTHEKAEELAKQWKYESVEKPEDFDPEIIINCTSVGFHNPKESPIAPKNFKGVKIAYDVIYGPKTKFIADAKKAGVPKIISGEQMLLEQGYAAFEAWTGEKAPQKVMQQVVEAHLS